MSNPFSPLLSAARRAWFLQRKKNLRQRIFQEYAGQADPEVQSVLAWLRDHPQAELPLEMIPPYNWADTYQPGRVPVEHDAATGFAYVIHKNQRVYFPRHATVANIQESVSIGWMEQDPRSPHRYVGDGFDVDAGDIAVMIGASDGLFSVSLMDRLSKAYLFEPDARWHETLRATFAPWGDKVEILPLAVGSVVKPGQTRLDTFFQNRPLPNYIQMDVEGFEQEVLNGAQRVLTQSAKLRLSICTYHRRLDFTRFSHQLGGLGYVISHSPGYYVLGVRMPYLRRGVLYAGRQTDRKPAA